MGVVPPDIASRGLDLIVVGAGINGAGIARDAAMRGLRVLMVDKSDIGSGTSSWSTRLIHGGLRYLEYAELGLVRESLREREVLLRGAPHLVRPLPLLIPIYRGATRGRLKVRAGMVAYDALSRGKSLPRHRMLSREQALEREPGLCPDGLAGAAVYHDAQVEFAERLVLENALDARDRGALVIPYARVDRILLEGNRARGIAFEDLRDGSRHEAFGRVVINVGGPWVDEVLDGLGAEHRPSVPRLIGGTRGSHVIVDPFPGAPSGAVYTEARSDGRPFFIIPWNGRYLIGTSDIRQEAPPDEAVATDDEIAYLLEETLRVIPGSGLNRASVLYTYSGVRPLPYEPGKRPSAVTRRHIVRDESPRIDGLISVIGGKLTTYRSLAEDVVDAAIAKLGLERKRCRTADEPLPGARAEGGFEAFSGRFRETSGLDAPTADRLLRVYGAHALRVTELAEAEPDLAGPLVPGTPTVRAEVIVAFLEEIAIHVTDALFRRTMLGLEPGLGERFVGPMIELAGDRFGWDEPRRRAERAVYEAYVERFRSGTIAAHAAV